MFMHTMPIHPVRLGPDAKCTVGGLGKIAIAVLLSISGYLCLAGLDCKDAF